MHLFCGPGSHIVCVLANTQRDTFRTPHSLTKMLAVTGYYRYLLPAVTMWPVAIATLFPWILVKFFFVHHWLMCVLSVLRLTR